MNKKVTEALVKFSAETTFDNLPDKVVHETKRILLDIIGCALGAIDLDKGRISVELARYLGGRPEATILGVGDKVSSTNAAFANGELMHSMDFCPILPPAHVAPFVTAAPLALVEVKKASGKDLITALALAHEVTSRIGISLGSMRGEKEGFPPHSYGFGCNEFGAAVGAAKILGLDQEKMGNAFGIAGYFVPLPAHTKWVHTLRNGMTKYGPSGWTAQGGTMAALLAERGYKGDKTILDGDYGFWAMNGSETCLWDKITDKLGEDWIILKTTYKYWPCCGLFGASLDAFTKVIEDNNIEPEEIERVLIKAEGYARLPRFQTMEIGSHVDAQMNLPYNIAVAAHRIKVGPDWQARSTIDNPKIREFMKKVSYETNPKCEEARHQDLVVEGRPYISRRPAYAKVSARGTSFTQEVEYAKWLSMDVEEFRASDEGLADKFRANASKVLKGDKLEKAIEAIYGLEKIDDITRLIPLLTA